MDVMSYREVYRNKAIPGGYHGVENVFINVFICLLISIIGVINVDAISFNSILIIISTFLLFNVVEYCFHRWLSHNNDMKKSFCRHVIEHHGFFDDNNMSSEQGRDIHVTILPTKTIIIYNIAALIFGGVITFFFGFSEGLIAIVSVSINILILDMFHYYYHLDNNIYSRVMDRIPFMRTLKEHHRLHHKKSQMFLCNFNITFPLCDVVFRTKLGS